MDCAADCPADLLGLNLAALTELVRGMPADALAQARTQAAPKAGDTRFDGGQVNGYVNQELIRQKHLGMSICEQRRQSDAAGVGRATVFVSWFLGQALDEVLDALDVFLEQSGLDRGTTYFWVCDYSFDLIAIAEASAKGTGKGPTEELPDRVKAIGHTVLLLDPWHAPAPLKRIWCGPTARTLTAQRLPPGSRPRP